MPRKGGSKKYRNNRIPKDRIGISSKPTVHINRHVYERLSEKAQKGISIKDVKRLAESIPWGKFNITQAEGKTKAGKPFAIDIIDNLNFRRNVITVIGEPRASETTKRAFARLP